MSKTIDAAVNPQHYKGHPCGVEAVEIIKTMPFLLGTACKYLYRLGKKDDPMQELKKAEWYLQKWLAENPRNHAPVVNVWSKEQRKFLDWVQTHEATRADKAIQRLLFALIGLLGVNVRTALAHVRVMIADIENGGGLEDFNHETHEGTLKL